MKLSRTLPTRRNVFHFSALHVLVVARLRAPQIRGLPTRCAWAVVISWRKFDASRATRVPP